MANSYTMMADNFSFPQEAAKDFMTIVNACQESDMDALPKWFINEFEIDKDAFTNHEYDTINNLCVSNMEYNSERKELYISEEEYADVYSTGVILSSVMKEHNVDAVIMLHGAFICDKLRPGEFGGITVAVGPGVVKSETTYDMEAELEKSVQEALASDNSPRM